MFLYNYLKHRSNGPLHKPKKIICCLNPQTEPGQFSINEIEAYRDAIMIQRKDLQEALTDTSEDFIRYLLSYDILNEKEAQSIWKSKERSLVANRLVDMIADKPESSVGIYNILMIMKNQKGAAVLKTVCETFGKELEGATWAEGENVSLVLRN